MFIKTKIGQAQTIIALLVWWLACWFATGTWIDHQAQSSYRLESQHAEQFVADVVPSFNRILTTRNGVPRMLARDPEVVGTLARFGEHPSSAPSDEEVRRQLWSHDAALIETSRFLQDSAKNLGLDVLNLLNANGDCVASSSIHDAKNIIGTNFSDHDEFLHARAGQPGYLVTMGKKMRSAGLNYYAPVMHQGRFVGVVSGGNALASFTNLIKQADAYLTERNGVVMLARDPSLMMHALPNAPFAQLDAATRQAFYQSTELPTLQLAPWGNGRFPELLRAQGRDTPAILRSQLVTDGGLTLNVLWPMPQMAMLEQQRLIYAVTIGTIGTLLMLLTATAVARRREQLNLTQALMQREQEFRSLAANLPVAVIRYDSLCRRRYLNPAAEKMLRGNVTELQGQPPGGPSVPATPAMIEHYQRQMVEVLTTGTARDLDVVFDALPVDRQEHYEVRFAPERDADGETVGVLAIWLDITERKKYEQTLLERVELEQRQSQFFSVAPGFFYTTVRHPDGEYEITFASPGIRDLLGLEPQVVMQDSGVLFNAAHPDDQKLNTCKSEESERDLAPFHIEYRIIHPTQGLRWVEVHLVTQRLANGGTRWDGFMHDITERKSLGNQVAQRERDFRSLADNMPDNVARWNVDGRYLYLNPAHERTFGISASDMIGKSIPDSHVNVKAVIAEVVSTGQSLVMVHQPVLDENGDIRLHDVSIVPECDETGIVVSVLGIGRDMTDVYRMQETIATSEQAFRSLAESSPDFIVRYDRKGRHLYFNDRLLKLLGLASADEALGKLPDEVWPDGRFTELEQVATRAMESGNQGDIEIIQPTGSGTFRYHQLFVVPEHDATGQIIGAIAFGREITAIREAERKLAHFIDNLPGMVYTFRTSLGGLGSFPYVSPAIQDLYGLTPEDVKDDMAPIHALAHPDDRPRIEAAIAESTRTMAPMHIESRVCRAGQPERWLDVRSVPERQADGSLLWYGLMLDITERKRMEEQLAAREQEFRALAENSPDTIARYAPGGVRTYINPLFARLAGKPVHDLLGVTAMDYQAAPGAITYHRALLHSLESGEDAECEYTWPTHDGRLITSHIRIVPEFGSDGKVASVLAIGRDITERKHLENELKQRETEFRALTENLPDPVFRYDRDCRRTYVNPAAVRVTGLPIEQLIGYTPTNCATMKKDSADRTMLLIRDVFATGERRSHFVEYVNEDGSMSEYQGLHVPEFDANGQVVSVLTIAHEVTNLRKAERRAASFFANMPGFAYTFVISPEGRMRFLFASQGIEDIFGLRPENVRDDAVPMRATAHSDEWPRVEAAIIEAARTQQPFQVETRMQRLDQPERWIECRSIPEQQAGGEVLWHGIMLDITGRKLAEQALDEARQRLHSVLQGIPDPVWMKDADGAFVVCNPGVARLFNMKEEEIVGKNDYDFFNPEQAEFYRNKDRTALEAGDVCINEEWWTFADNGERVLMETRKVPVMSTSGKLLGVLGVARDITERKRMEAAREAALTEAVRLAKTRSEFLAHMSHELRTPLNGILGYTQILQRDNALNPHHVEALAVMQQSGEHLLALIEDILDLARIEAGRLTLNVSPISLAAFLRGVTDIVRVRANEKEIEFICDFAPDLPVDIRGDEKRLRQVLLNLLANAVKFTHQGRVVLRVSRVDELRLAFVVEDTGVGIPASELESIFHPFEQQGNAKQRFGGSGLGLSISRQLMRLMGGDIWVDSHLGVGSRFGFELELAMIGPISLLLHGVPEADRRNQPPGSTPYVGVLDRRMVAPPLEILQTLYRLAQLGNMRDILQYAQHIADIDAQYQTFAAHLQQMAKGYQSKAIFAYVNKYLQDAIGE